MSGPAQRNPSRQLVTVIATAEAARSRCSLEEMLGTGQRATKSVLRGRQRAFQRIIAESGCSAAGLARVWGLSERSVALTLKRSFGPYTTETVARLAQQHGNARAAAIVRGEDPATNADLAAWASLGGSRSEEAA